ncbi:MAG TPA: cell division protein FtsQ/DivIB [Stellaceae bacterium]|nr:cell division protein FtsQ/DivIB [Stellaceae bacterium]
MKARKRAAPPPVRRRRRLPTGLRRSVRWGMPPALIAIGIGAVLLSGTPEGAVWLADAEARGVAASAAAGLVVNDIEVEGRTTTGTATILAALDARRGTPILAVSPSRAQRQLESLPWVRSAVIERHLPGTLIVRLVERQPLAVWQHAGRLELIDRQGEVIPVKDLGRFAHLPTVVGEDAAKHAARLLDMLAGEPALAARVTAAVRVDDRRWNVRIDRTIEVLLPEQGVAAAWARLAALDRTEKLFERNLREVDLRLPDRLVLRVVAPAQPEGTGKKAGPGKQAHNPGKST